MSGHLEEECALCGSDEDLVPDPNLEGIYICGACQARSDNHSAAIDHGYDDEEPKIE